MELLFCDGGVLEKNPSPHGGTWAWCLVHGDVLIEQASGFIAPPDLGTDAISNNQTELLAALLALEAMPEGWEGVLHSDSQVTLRRLAGGGEVPGWAGERIVRLRQTRRFTTVLLAGHPTRKELADGARKRNKLPTSKWNVLCDRLCNEAKTPCLSSLPRP